MEGEAVVRNYPAGNSQEILHIQQNWVQFFFLSFTKKEEEEKKMTRTLSEDSSSAAPTRIKPEKIPCHNQSITIKKKTFDPKNLWCKTLRVS